MYILLFVFAYVRRTRNGRKHVVRAWCHVSVRAGDTHRRGAGGTRPDPKTKKAFVVRAVEVVHPGLQTLPLVYTQL